MIFGSISLPPLKKTYSMQTFINSSWKIGQLTLANRLIQGPLAGYSCAPFRALFHRFQPPSYAVSEMISAQDLIKKPPGHNRYLARAPQEQVLAYQISGQDAQHLSKAALFLQSLGADLIDLNCGCPKTKIRKKGAGSALLEKPEHLADLVKSLREVLTVPLTVKIRIQGDERDFHLADKLQQAGADALIVHGRRWQDDYDIPCDFKQIARIKDSITIPVIANGDIADQQSLAQAVAESRCDAFMIARAGCGHPWLYQALLRDQAVHLPMEETIDLFIQHLQGLASLENEYKAILQSKSLLRYYFRGTLSEEQSNGFYQLSTITDIENYLYIIK